MITPNAQPPREIFKDEKIWAGSVAPSGAELLNFFMNVFTTVAGPGNVDELVSFNTSQQNHQMPANMTIDKIDKIQK